MSTCFSRCHKITSKSPKKSIFDGDLYNRYTKFDHAFNEIHGYLFGNQVLQRFGRYILDHLGDRGDVYRLDGTKFAILSTSLSIRELAENYEAFRTHFREGFVVDDKGIILDLNGGLFSLDDFSVDVPTVFTCLNYAYAESKVRRNGDLVEFYNDLTNDNQKQLEKLHIIRASFLQNYKGFCLYYQPVVDAKTEKLTGAEALIRWRSPEYGIVMPDQFIPLLEKDSLFPDLGRWILQTALEDARKILPSVPGFMIHVNLSYAQLEKPDFIDMVLDVLQETEYPPEQLCLEITERCRLLDLELLHNVILGLKEHGVRFALDDFGTGFSSIGLVMQLPFDTIKIDRSFVARIEDDIKEQNLIKDFTDAAMTYGATVCVEGIETEGMCEVLRQYPVTAFQGYYFSRPLEFYSFLAWKHEREQMI
ncbi:MAG: GGDEF domain-containing protein [Lachnospiraceae bacterium]|nr:GGDEF domain-containing protein [Lachnospiraceae bacterium]